jgi:FAD/FMN-containing dehydrogenase
VEVSGHGPLQQTLEEALAALLEEETASDALIAQSDRERADFLRLREGISDGELAEGGAVKHDIAVPINQIPETIRAVEALAAAQFPDCRLNIFGHIGDGNLHVNIRPPPGQSLTDLAPQKAAITEAVERLAVARGGSFSAEHGIGQMRLAGMQAHKSAVELALMRAVKQAFDPAALLNPGKILPQG